MANLSFVVAYVTPMRDTSSEGNPNKLVEVGFFTCDSGRNYHPGFNLTRCETREEVDSRAVMFGIRRVSLEAPIREGQGVFANARNEFYIADAEKPDYDIKKVRIA